MRPNVLLILADDLGFSDLGCYGGEIPTPNLDELGRRGARFSQFYNTARCSPSRASLLTGLHPHETGIGVLTRPDLPHGYPGTLDPAVDTAATVLGAAGWHTALFGKWHLAADVSAPNASWPTRRGFAEFFGTLAGCSSYFDPQTLTRGEAPADDARNDPDFYYTDAIADEAARWLRNRASGGDTPPFFLYLAFTAPHWPLHAKQDDVDVVRGLFDAGWDELRAERLERMMAEGIIGGDTALSDRDPSQPPWSEAAEKEWNTQRMETYAAQVVALDRAIGTVLQTLGELGDRDDTLVLFLSDNGASAEELPIGPLEEFAQKDTSMRTPTRQGATVRIGNSADIAPGGEDTYTSYGVPWANLSNTPLRRYKRWVHEGGISTPLIVNWPAGGIESGIIHTPAQLVDILPTIRDAVGLETDAGMAGRSLLPALRGSEIPEATLYWEHIGNAAIRRGNWKLVRDHPGAWELYDIAADRTELDDRAEDRPEIVAELSAEWERWARRVGVLDWDAMLARYEQEGTPLMMAEE